MAHITPGNRLYLYQLFARELGVGKQTMLSRVEEVLSADDIQPSDLECSSVREVLEALDDFVRLSVFKKGRVYATVLPKPEWDQLIAAAAEETDKRDKSAGAKGGPKSWKKKRSNKSPKPAKPRPKGRPQPKVAEEDKVADVQDAASPAAEANASAIEAGASTEAKPLADATEQTMPSQPVEIEPQQTQVEAEPASQSESQPEFVKAGSNSQPESDKADPNSQPESNKGGSEPESQPQDDEHQSTGSASEAQSQKGEPQPTETAPESIRTPSISLTITYTPDDEDEPLADEGPLVPESPQPVDAPTPNEAGRVAKPEVASPAQPDPAFTPATTGPVSSEAAPLSHASASEPAIQPSAQEPVPSAPVTAPSAPAAPEPTVMPSTPAPKPIERTVRLQPQVILPHHFAAEVVCKNAVLSALYQILPFDVDPIALLDEDWNVARSTETYRVEGGSVIFPLRYLYRKDGEPIKVRVRRKARSTSGKRWELVSVGDAGMSLDQIDFDGLPTEDDGAWSDLVAGAALANDFVTPGRLLASFAHIGPWDQLLSTLAELAAPEPWGNNLAVLREYVTLTFYRIMQQDLLTTADDLSWAAFDTGLLTPDARSIYMRFRAGDKDNPWELQSFGTEVPDPMPQPASYVEELADIAFVAPYTVRTSSILARTYGADLQPAIDQALVQARRNYRVATPAYDPRADRLRLLLPIQVGSDETRALVLARQPQGGYLATAILSLERARACARVVSSDAPSWLSL